VVLGQTSRSGVGAGGVTALSASLYAADPFRLAEEIDAVLSDVESFHLDVMDGVFAPEYGLTARVIGDLTKRLSIPLDVHLMVEKPMRPAARFAEMGVRSIAVHLEAGDDFVDISRVVRSNGSRVYVALRHTTPISEVSRIIDDADGCLFLTAPAGGGDFDHGAFARLAQRPPGLYTIADGKIGPEHFTRLAELEIDVAVVGGALFSDARPRERAECFTKALARK